MSFIGKLSALGALFVLLSTSFAFAGGRLYMVVSEPPHWVDSSFPVPYNINPDSAIGYIQGSDPAQQFVDATVAAFSTWQDIPTSRITFAQGPDSSDLLDTLPDDGVNLMVFHNIAVIQGVPIHLPPGVLGITNTAFDFETGIIMGGAITLNPDPLEEISDPDWSTSGDPHTLDVQAVILHEAGHLQGLCHSVVRNDMAGEMEDYPSNSAVMFPFIGLDVADARMPDQDDIAWHGLIYPSASYDTTFGSIQGDVPFGSTLINCLPPGGANGAHVVARDLNDLVGGEPRMIVGTYSYLVDGQLGRYTIPGLPPGDYGVWIEPLDGSPVMALQINSRIQFTTHTVFPEDWYSGPTESGAEGTPNDPASAAVIPVTVGSTVTGIDSLIEDFVAGCINVAEAYNRGRHSWSGVAAQAVLLLPLALVYILKRRIAKRG